MDQLCYGNCCQLVENQATLKTKSPDFLHFAVTGFEALAVSYGVDSVQFGDALNLLQTVIARVSCHVMYSVSLLLTNSLLL
jgi:hypothetical protein